MVANILYYNSSDGALTQNDDVFLDRLSEFVLEKMATDTYAGSIAIGTSNSIGTFTNTFLQGGVGDTNTGTNVLSETYTLSQEMTVRSTVDPPNYVGLETITGQVIIQESATTLEDLADEILDRLVNDDFPNSYFLGTSAPNDGGTWVSIGSLADTLENDTIVNNNYQLWHKISSPTYTSVGHKPIKLSGSEIVEFTDTELENLIKIVEERIVATSIGTYVIQSSAPSTGTWVNAGTVSDVRRQTADVNYAGAVDFIGNYAGAVDFIGNYAGAVDFIGNYAGSVNFAGDYVGSTTYFGNYVGNYVGNYNTQVRTKFGTFPEDYTGNYAGNYVGNYVDVTDYIGGYVGNVNYGGNYVGDVNYAGDYVGNVNYAGDYVGDVNYAGETVQSSTTTVITVSLFKRVS